MKKNWHEKDKLKESSIRREQGQGLKQKKKNERNVAYKRSKNSRRKIQFNTKTFFTRASRCLNIITRTKQLKQSEIKRESDDQTL